MPAAQASPAPAKGLSEPQKALRKLGLARDIDLALHLPIRYEDETRIVKLRDAHGGDTVQIEGTVKVDGKPEKWSKGRLKVTLQPGEQKELNVVVDASAFK